MWGTECAQCRKVLTLELCKGRAGTDVTITESASVVCTLGDSVALRTYALKMAALGYESGEDSQWK